MRDRRDFDSYVAEVAENIRRYDGHAVFEQPLVRFLTACVLFDTRCERNQTPPPVLGQTGTGSVRTATETSPRSDERVGTLPLSPVGMCWGDGRAHDVLWRTRKASEGLQHRRVHAAHGPAHELLMIGQGDGALVLAAPAAACPHTGSADLLIMWEHFPKLVEPTLWNGWHGMPTQERKAWEMAWHFFRSGMGPQEAASETHDIIFD